MKLKKCSLILTIAWSCSIITSVWCAQPSRTVMTRQGAVRGLKIDLRPTHQALGMVDAFLGMPYAGAPVGHLRFMPPTSPQPWTYLREVTEFAPVCPQILPDLNDTQKALDYMTVGRLDYLKNLIRYLYHQSEDCLYLNIYTPSPRSDKLEDKINGLPVMVFVHGESYEWNSGNPYDGSVLAAYGQVVVVTLNYRLGVLGFLRPSLYGDVVTNFGLLDQIAALHWLQENVVYFGGDPNLITLVGHGTGASLVSLLLTSPVAQAKKGLFRRAILMSGTSLSPMSMSRDPQDISAQVAAKLNCSTKSDEALSKCLKKKPLDDIHKILFTLDVPKYSTPFGPIVDRLIVPNEPLSLMSDSNPSNSFFRYDVMMGLTEIEAFHLFPASTATYGVSSKEQKKIVREFLKYTYKVNVEQIQTAVMNEYIDYRYTEDNHMVNRNTLLSILSDARVAAPVLQTAKLHAKGSKHTNTFLYVFKHVTKYGHYPEVYGSIHGEELAYVLGMPLTGGSFHLQLNYTRQEQILSEIIMQYWISFAKTGNASGTAIRTGILSSEFDEPIEDFAPTWPNYNMDGQQYMAIGLEPDVKSFYRPHKIALWNNLIPDLVRLNIPEEEKTETEKPETSFPKFPEPASPGFAASPPHQDNIPDEILVEVTAPPPPRGVTVPPKKVASYGLDVEAGVPVVIVIIVGLVLLLLNLCFCIGVVYQKHRVRQREHNLRMRIKRLSDVGMITNNVQENNYGHHDDDDNDADGYCTGGSVNNDRCAGDRQIKNERNVYGADSSDEDEESIEVLMPAQHYAMDSEGVYPVVQVGSLKSSLKRSRNLPGPIDRNGDQIFFQSLPPDRSKSISNFPHYEASDMRQFYPPHQHQQQMIANYAPIPFHPSPPSENGTIRSKSAAAINLIPRQQDLHNNSYVEDDVGDDGARAKLPKRLGLPKVLPDLPSVSQLLARRKAANSSRPPSPIIEVVPVAQYEAMYPSKKSGGGHDTSFQDYPDGNYGGVVYPIYNPNNGRQDPHLPEQLQHLHHQQQQQQRGNVYGAYEGGRHMPQQQQQQHRHQFQHPVYVPQQSQQPYHSDDERRQNYDSPPAPKVAFTLPPQHAPPMRLPLSTLTSAPNKKNQQQQLQQSKQQDKQQQRQQQQQKQDLQKHHQQQKHEEQQRQKQEQHTHQKPEQQQHQHQHHHHQQQQQQHHDEKVTSKDGQKARKSEEQTKSMEPQKQKQLEKQVEQQQNKPQQHLQEQQQLQKQIVLQQMQQQQQQKTQPQVKQSKDDGRDGLATNDEVSSSSLVPKEEEERRQFVGRADGDVGDTSEQGKLEMNINDSKDNTNKTENGLANKNPSGKNVENGTSKNDVIKIVPPRVRGPAWLAFTNKQNNGNTNPFLGEDKNSEIVKVSGVSPATKNQNLGGTPGPEPAPLACEENTLTKDLDSENVGKSERPKTPVLRKVGEKTPPGTLKRDRPTSSCKSWCSQYSQSFLAKTIDTPLPNVEPLNDDNDEQVSIL